MASILHGVPSKCCASVRKIDAKVEWIRHSWALARRDVHKTSSLGEMRHDGRQLADGGRDDDGWTRGPLSPLPGAQDMEVAFVVGEGAALEAEPFVGEALEDVFGEGAELGGRGHFMKVDAF